jgi:hypothetical protein
MMIVWEISPVDRGEIVANIICLETAASLQQETFNRPELVLFRMFKREHEAVNCRLYCIARKPRDMSRIVKRHAYRSDSLPSSLPIACHAETMHD